MSSHCHNKAHVGGNLKRKERNKCIWCLHLYHASDSHICACRSTLAYTLQKYILDTKHMIYYLLYKTVVSPVHQQWRYHSFAWYQYAIGNPKWPLCGYCFGCVKMADFISGNHLFRNDTSHLVCIIQLMIRQNAWHVSGVTVIDVCCIDEHSWAFL